MEKVDLVNGTSFLTKEEYKKWGQFGFSQSIRMGSTETSSLKYLAGIESISTELSEIPQNSKTIIEMLKEGLVFKIKINNKTYALGLKKENLKKIVAEKQEDVIANKEKSVIGRAIVGGLLFGGIGAVTGGLSALNPTKKTINGGAYLSLFITEENQEKILLFKVDNKNINFNVKFFSKEYFHGLFENKI